MIDQFSSFIDVILSFILLYKYAALFLVTFIAALAVPFPASTSLIAAGSFASLGYMDLYAVLITAMWGNLLGDWTGYLLAYVYGRNVIERIGFGRLLRSSLFLKIERYMQDMPQSLIYMTRFTTEAGPMVNLVSGLTRVPPQTYFLYEIAGEISYVLLYGLSGYYLGTQWEENVSFIAKGALVMISLSMTAGVVQYILFRRKK